MTITLTKRITKNELKIKRLEERIRKMNREVTRLNELTRPANRIGFDVYFDGDDGVVSGGQGG
jgi:hypothetical protein